MLCSHLDSSLAIVEQLVLPPVGPGNNIVLLLLLLLFGGNRRGDSGSRGRGGYGRVVGVETVHHCDGLLLWLLLWLLLLLRLWLLRRWVLLRVVVELLLRHHHGKLQICISFT